MMADPQDDPVPTLDYYTQEDSAILRTLVRLLLLAGAINGVLEAASFAASPLADWQPPPHLFDIALAVGQAIAWLTVTVACLLYMKTAQGRMAAISAQAVAILLDATYYIRLMFQDAQVFSTIVLVTDLIMDWLLPLLIMTVLIRPDLRRYAAKHPSAS